jgi:hypothetical protein
MKWRGLSVAFVLGLLAAGRPVAAQQPTDIERAKASFRAGANAYAAGDYLAAIQALESAYELTPLPAIAFSLAQAERKQYVAQREPEHGARALELYQRYLQQEPNGPRRNDALAAVAELSRQLGAAAPSAVAAPTPKPPVRPTRLMIVSEVPGARISLDGGAEAASPLIREVAPGRHRARVVARGYQSVERDVTAISGELIMSELRPSESPTSLYVWAPAGADIYVDGVYVAVGGKLVTVPLASGRHQLVVAQNGKQLERRDFTLEHGRTHTEYVTLEPTQQRGISELLFIGSGLGVGAGIVLSALAVRSQNNAEELLAIRRFHTISTPQMIAYNASIIERDRYRTAAVIGFASAAGMLITGLFLHELDTPSLPAAPPREPQPSASRTPRRVVFSPVTATGDFGAAFQLRF